MDPRTAAVALAAGRLVIGAGLAAAPRRTTRSWIGSHADDEGARLMARAVGGRDVGLAVGILAALQRRRRSPWRRGAERRQLERWLDAAVLADAVDALATLAARRGLPPSSVALGASIAGGSALAHLWLRRELG